MTTPDDRRYHEEHTWARREDDGVRVGITDHAQDQLSDVVYVGLPENGTRVEQGQQFGEIESTKTLSDLISPVTGTVKQRNDDLGQNPTLVNEDPYGRGWMVVVDVKDEAQLEDLLTGDQYDERA